MGAFGDGGAITTDDPVLAERVRKLRSYGSVTKYHHEVQGFNSRLDELQAAVLHEKLKVLDEWNARRTRLAEFYTGQLGGISDLALPPHGEANEHAWHLYVVKTAQRDPLARFLADKGIGTIIHYPVPPHLSQAYADLNLAKGSLPVAERLADTVLSLPIGPHLSLPQAETVVTAIKEFFGHK